MYKNALNYEKAPCIDFLDAMSYYTPRELCLYSAGSLHTLSHAEYHANKDTLCIDSKLISRL